MKIAFASDHGGFALKQILLPYARELGHEVTDLGCFDESSVDYPDYGVKAAEAVASGAYARGVVICGTGIGISIAANKVKGVRCALCTDATMARLCREHNDANVLSLGGRILGAELAKDVLAAFLATEFSNGERHRNRLAKIAAYEEKQF